MRLGIDLAPLVAHRSGIPVFARQVLEGIVGRRPEWTLSGFSWRGWEDAKPIVAQGSGGPAGAMPWRLNERARTRLTGLGLALPFVSAARLAARRIRFEAAGKPRIDLFFALNFLPPGNIGCPIVPVVHDLFHLIDPRLVHPARRRALARLPEILAQAPRVQCVSRHTAADVTRHFGVSPQRVDIVHPAVRPEFLVPARDEEILALGLQPRSYWLAVGMGESRKNLGLLVDVVRQFPDLCTPARPLVLAGAPGWQRGGPRSQLRQLRLEGRVRELGFVPLPVLNALYAHARALLMPSLYEGFGLPLAEALAAGAPVIAADNTSLPEVSGGHALHLDARDVEGWGKAMRDLLHLGADPSVIEAGRRHVRQFNAEATALAALKSLESV